MENGKRTLLVRVQRQHVSLEVLRAREAFGAARNGTDVCAFLRPVGLGHPAPTAFFDQMRNGYGGWNPLALRGAGTLRVRGDGWGSGS